MIMQELRLSWRSLLRRENHGFTFATVATLTLAMAAVTTIASLAYGVLWAPLPFRQSDRVVHLEEENAARGVSGASSYPNFLSWRDQSASFSGMAAIRGGSANLGGEAGFASERMVAHSVTPDLWTVLGVPLLLGTGLGDPAKSAKQVVIGERLWRQRFQASPAIIGRTLRIDAEIHEVVGVAPQDMGFTRDADLWLPIVSDEAMSNRGDRRLIVLARLRDGVSPDAAQVELSVIAEGLAKQFPDSNQGWGLRLSDAHDWIVGADARQRLLMLLGAVALLMLVAFTNVANLQIARATARIHEVSVRQALGASMRRVMVMLTIENLSLVLAGATIGVFISYLLLQSIHAVLPSSMPRQSAIGFSFGIAMLINTLAGVAAMLFGATATWIARHAQPYQALGKSSRAGLGTHATPLRDALVMVQFALATTLVLVSALLMQQYLALRGAVPGFDSRGVVSARITLPAPSSEEEHARSLAHFDQLLEGVRTLPGVKAVGLSSEIPMGELNTGMAVWGPNTAANTADPGKRASWRIVTADYLNALKVPLLRGRQFAAHEEPALSTLISAGLAARLFTAGSDPIGQHIYLENGERRTIVGVVGDVRQIGLGQPYTPTMYFPTTWYLWPTMTLAARTDGDAASLIHAMREVARRVSPDHPLFDMRTLDSVLDASVARQKLQTLVIALFAISSLLLAALGIAGVMSYLLVRRAPELALRMALGASRSVTTRSVLLRGTGVCAIGVVIGTALALWQRQLLQITEPAGSMALTILVVTAILLLVGTFASWWPLRRISAISPAQLLRGD